MAGRISTARLILGITLSFVFFLQGSGVASSFPFRAINIGDQLPPVVLQSLGGRSAGSPAQFAGKPLLLLFFGADLPAKKKRAVKTLKAVRELAAFAAAQDLLTLVVDVQGDAESVMAEVATSAGFTGDLYADIDNRVYGALGIFVLPSVLLVAADGTVVAGLGYSSDVGQRLKGEIEVMFGIKSRAQLEADLHPVMVEKSVAEKGGKRHFKLALTMRERGQPEAAMRELEKAVALDPTLGKAYGHLGCLQLDDGRSAEAEASLAKSRALEPDFVIGQICQARLKASGGDLDGAIEDIGFLMLRNSRNDHLHYVLGLMLEEKSDPAGALREYRKAYELLEKRARTE